MHRKIRDSCEDFCIIALSPVFLLQPKGFKVLKVVWKDFCLANTKIHSTLDLSPENFSKEMVGHDPPTINWKIFRGILFNLCPLCPLLPQPLFKSFWGRKQEFRGWLKAPSVSIMCSCSGKGGSKLVDFFGDRFFFSRFFFLEFMSGILKKWGIWHFTGSFYHWRFLQFVYIQNFGVGVIHYPTWCWHISTIFGWRYF